MPRRNTDNALATVGCLLVAGLLIACVAMAMYLGYLLAMLDTI